MADLPTKTAEGQHIIYFQSGTHSTEGVQIVNPKTKKLGSSVDTITFGRWQDPKAREYKENTIFRAYVADKQLEAARQARQTAKEERTQKEELRQAQTAYYEKNPQLVTEAPAEKPLTFEEERQERIRQTLERQRGFAEVRDGSIVASEFDDDRLLTITQDDHIVIAPPSATISAPGVRSFVEEKRRAEAEPQTLQEAGEKLRIETIESVQEKVKAKGGLQGQQIIPGESFTVLPVSSTFNPIFKGQLGSGKMTDIFNVPKQGLGVRYDQFKTIGTTDAGFLTDISEATPKKVKAVSGKVVRESKALWQKTEVIEEWTKKNLPSLENRDFEREALLYDPFTRKAKKDIEEKFPISLPEPVRESLKLPKGSIFKQTERGVSEITTGYYENIRTKPRKTIAYTAAFFALPFALKPIGAAFKLLPLGSGASQILGPSVTGVLLGSYAKNIKERVSESDRPLYEFGGILGTEVTPMITGSFLGTKALQKITGWYYTIGTKKVDIRKIAREELLAGTEQYQISKQPHIKYFQDPQYRLPGTESRLGVYHAGRSAKTTAFTDIVKGRSSTVGIGKEYLPGGFVAPSLSANFLGIGGDISLYSGELFPAYGRSYVIYTYPRGLAQAPGRTPGAVSKFLLKRAKKGFVYTHTPKFKPEVEGLLTPGTDVFLSKSRFFTKYKGVRVPIYEYEVAGGINIKSSLKFGDVLASSYYSAGSYPLISPAHLVASSLLSKVRASKSKMLPKSSRVYSSSTSRVSSSVLSSRPSSLISSRVSSKVSSRLSSKQSSLMSSKPSSLVSSAVSSRISSVLSSKSYSKSSSMLSSMSSIASSSTSAYYNTRGGGLLGLPKVERGTEQGYDVFVKRKQFKIKKKKYKGRGYIKANKRPLTRNAAINRGMYLVDRYTNRSFKIKKTNRRVTRREEPLNSMISSKFRSSKKTPRIFVEKSTYAIDSIPEKQGIPYEAARLRRAGKIKPKPRRKRKQRMPNSNKMLRGFRI